MPSRAAPRFLLGRLLAGSVPLAVALSAQGTDLPSGPGADLVRARCLTCHGDDLIRQQRLARTGWQREVDKMARWGATLSDRERGVVLDYLSAHWSLEPVSNPSSAAPAEPGAETFRRQCLVCHDTDLIEQQRLGRAGWMREVDRMIRWGAGVSETEKGALVDYLGRRFGRPASDR
jgi:mono/diheme cytochrome c family protein